METSGIHTAVEQQQARPEERYAALHRRIEAGDSGDASWVALAKICLELDKGDEAVEAYRKLEAYGPRARIHALLADKGLLDEKADAPKAPTSCVTDDDLQGNLLDSIWDAVQFLVQDRVPLAAIGAMGAFGLLLAIGGIVQGLVGMIAVSFLVLPIAIALYALVAAFAARILTESLRGLDDAPELPTRDEAIAEAKTAGLYFVLTAIVLLAPGILWYWVLPLGVVSALLLVLGWSLLPFVFTVRLLSDGWRETSPARCWKVLWRTRPQVLLAVGVNALAFAPAALTMYGALAQPAYLGACFAGLLSVMPIFVSARMLGQMLYYRRKSLGDALNLGRAK